MNPDRLPLVMLALGGLVVVLIVGLATGSWVWFAVALLVHLVASAIVIWGSVRSARTGTEADSRSEELEEIAAQATRGRKRTIESELEALKRE